MVIYGLLIMDPVVFVHLLTVYGWVNHWVVPLGHRLGFCVFVYLLCLLCLCIC